MKRRIGVLLAVAASTFMASVAAQQSDKSSSLIVVGDPQLHNYLGGHLFQTTPLAYRFSKVAQRYPEMNLLAGYAFDEGVALATALPGGSPNDPIILLGDGTNAACTSEFDRYMKHVNALRGKSRIHLWAHGNHDTYMVGTTNEYPPSQGEDGFFNMDALTTMQGSDKPVNASYWKPGALTDERAWSVVCHDGKGSLPMNKSMWMARYLESFGKDIKLTSTPAEESSYKLDVAPTQGSELASRNFRMLGRWYPPPRDMKPMQGIYHMYDSYLVQAIDVGDRHRLILIDTSTCGGASLTLTDNAGEHGCVNEDQIEDIEELAKTDRTLVYGGHFHFDEIKKQDRKKLLKAFNAQEKKWTYLSAHTHKAGAPRTHIDGGWLSPSMPLGPSKDDPRYEVNLGSTTDWPMQAHRVALDDSPVGVTTAEGGFSQGKLADRPDRGRTVTYVAQPLYKGTEVCRHVDAAKKLAGMVPAHVWSQPWRVERRDMTQCEGNRVAAQQELAAYEQTIADRMSNREYREAALAIMRSASEAFGPIP